MGAFERWDRVRGETLVESLFEVERRDGLHPFLNACCTELERFRLRASATDWDSFVASGSVAKLRQSFEDEPYCARGLLKPRGYAGDAVLIDYIYETTPLPEETSRRGLQINKWISSESKAFQAVRHRRMLAASYIDSAIAENPHARILSIACGHLRELALCKFDRSQWRGELVAIDQDARSLQVVDRTYSHTQVKALRLRIAKLLDGSADLGKFDLIYSTGLTDYLDDSLVQALGAWCKRSLNAGGVSFLANFDQCEERGFMEAVMDWRLTYRSQEQLKKLVDCPSRMFSDPLGVVCYAEF